MALRILWLQVRRCSSRSLIPSVQTNSAGSVLHVKWPDREESRFHAAWLRINCQSPNSQHINNEQKFIAPHTLPRTISIENAWIKEKLFVSWRHEPNHLSEFRLDWLQNNCYSSRMKPIARGKPVYDRYCTSETEIPSYSYTDVSRKFDVMTSWIKDLYEIGITVIKNAPISAGNNKPAVQKVAELIGPIMVTSYGKIFYVRSEEKAINLAYTSVELDLHMDFPYFITPPGVQLLHCIECSDRVVGGEQMFLDTLLAAEDYRKTFPHYFAILASTKATFQKIHYDREFPMHRVYQRTHFKLNDLDQLVEVFWSPAFEGPLRISEELVEPYYEAYFHFSRFLHEHPAKIKRKIELGDVVVFNNVRILHGRTQFELNGGSRHLQGAYISQDEFFSPG
ncbi:gamma-butyrobetaine dioxygenase-like isoform X2 [Oscarella lobularis]|uniref:gamma-butyrobetaine dioxygenase-like isoform X2 n=1 Tax=Oscarella lobularis TaxID=121494 RepID=UPI00331372B5